MGTALNEKCKEEKCIYERAYLWKSNVQAMNTFLKGKAKFISIIQPNHYAVNANDLNQLDKRMLNENFGWELNDKKSWELIEDFQTQMANSGELLSENYNKPFLFSNTEEKNLVDSCCHLTEIGNKILAKKIAESINKLVR